MAGNVSHKAFINAAKLLPENAEGDFLILPGLADVHVHLREPGFCYKEDIASGTAAAARGGFAAVCAMPNLNPVPDSAAHLAVELEAIKKSSVVAVLPYGAVTVGEEGKEIAALEEMAGSVVAFSDDGHGIADPAVMEEALIRAKALGKIIAAHCEDKAFANGAFRAESGLNRTKSGIFAKAEWRMLERDLNLVAKTRGRYHACHISTKESVELIREAKRSGLDVSCETAPHYLLLTVDDIAAEGKFKMNPPIGDKADREALLSGISDGTVDMIATDHAPHAPFEKARGAEGPFGIVGLETAFATLYTKLVVGGILGINDLTRLMSEAPSKRFGIDLTDTASVFEVGREYTIDSSRFLSKGRSTPFEGWKVKGECVLTAIGDKIVWKK